MRALWKEGNLEQSIGHVSYGSTYFVLLSMVLVCSGSRSLCITHHARRTSAMYLLEVDRTECANVRSAETGGT